MFTFDVHDRVDDNYDDEPIEINDIEETVDQVLLSCHPLEHKRFLL